VSTTENSNANDKTGTSTKTPPEKPSRRGQSDKKTSRPLLLPIIGLLLLGSIVGGVWLFQTMSRQNVQQQDAINVLREKLQAVQQQSQNQLNGLQETLARQQRSQDELRDNLSTLLKRNEHLRKDWLLGEAEYLLKLASYRLQLERDTNTALRAMRIADERLRDIGDPALLTVRKLLADDENALRNISGADITGMSLTLSALINNIDKLPLNASTPEQPSTPVVQKTGETFTNWRAIPAAIWQELKTLVRIRQHNTNIVPLLSPKEQFYLLQNLHLQLEQARLALLLGKGKVFTERMQTAQAWLQRFFDLKDPMVQNTLQSLQQLAAINIEPEIPNIEKSYQALKSYMADMVPAQTDIKQNPPAPTTNKSPVEKSTKNISHRKKTRKYKTPEKNTANDQHQSAPNSSKVPL